RDRLVVLHLAGQLASELDGLDVPPKQAPKRALDGALNLLLDRPEYAHLTGKRSAEGPRSVAVRRRSSRRASRRHGRAAQDETSIQEGISAPIAAWVEPPAATTAAPSTAHQAIPATTRGPAGRARRTSGKARAAATRTSAMAPSSGRCRSGA